jgi:TPR repeat protein
LKAEVAKLKKDLQDEPLIASNNIAAAYRQLGNPRRAFHWWMRTAGMNDGEAWLEVGYCLQYGIGTHRNPSEAIRAYRQAISRECTTSVFGEEEAQYHLAIALLDRGRGSRREAERLLERASEDGDYPQASDLLVQLREKRTLSICRCRRELPRRLGGKANCKLHKVSRLTDQA